MNRVSQHRIRSSLLTGTMVMAIGLIGGTAAAQASPCVVGPGVTQTETTVTGSPGNDTIDCGGTSPAKTINGNGGNDTITGTDFNDVINGGDGNDTLTGGTGDDSLNGGLGGDTISGSAGNDTLVGASNDGVQDSLDGGLGTDTCQGPAPDPDILANCENTTTPPASGPGSSEANANDLCHAVGGTFVEVQPVGYNCLLIPGNHRVAEARRICQGSGLVFADVARVLLVPGSYSCLL
jgi:hemolysin type calcium-binding protein